MKLLMALALASLPLPALAQAPAAADTDGKTAAGVQYVQPKDWTATTRGPAVLFVSPEKDLRAVVVDVGAAADGAAAAAKAWSLYRPDAAPTVRLATPGRPGEDWDERLNLSYETLPTERATRSALALRKGAAWTVLIVDGSAGTAAKRSAAMSVVREGLHPVGYQTESFAGRTAHRLTPDRVRALRDFVAESARELGVPGVGLALIDQGKVVWQGGIGVRALGSPEPVDEHTKFMIASNTKGLSTLLLSVLADEGKLRWDQKVTDLYPAFRLGNDEVTRSVLVRHLVCACTGLPRKDYSFILADPGAPAAATFNQLADTMPTSQFGDLFQYNNQMASAAGYVGGHLLYPEMEIGAAYDRAMEEKIFKPLGMTDSTFDYAKGMAGNWAAPHGLDVDGRVTLMSNDFNFAPYPYRPAGAAFSTTADMVRYVQLELSKGITPEGERVVSEANLVERRKKGVQVGPGSWYGMGLFQRDAWGIPVVTHGGTLLGYHSNWYALPEAGVGAVILTNADPGAAMLGPFLRRLLEVLYDGQPEAARDVATAAARIKAQAAARRERLTFPGDPAVLAKLARHYRDSEVGQISVGEQGGQKWIKAGFVEGPIATRANPDGSVSIVSVGPGNIGVEALVGTADGKRTLTINDGQQHQYVYVEDQ
ncbi:serine hydrolase domain-containing protein [Sphingopyxis panaciterrulae]|uniref:CubicO group peptidase (Beta-lactamase class C family) n=1 Tax=Sphingopyxis panaciterrulae TaxID=462372 RepID=A0A7W9B3G5_9SPHN|nr:serine hydrolase domain-containing protein [Sphingopyxis panaciterrulae]MBB5705579.1 CubicO group peptidase (beta-lactamase class C family) [Sphingopyxis panaciterrulae]